MLFRKSREKGKGVMKLGKRQSSKKGIEKEAA